MYFLETSLYTGTRKQRVHQRSYYARNKEFIIAKRRADPDHKIRSNAYQTNRRLLNPVRAMLVAARRRAKIKNLEFTISITDIVIPNTCPLLGIPIIPSKGIHAPNSPSLDRFDSSKGYIPGNVWVISYRANTLKSNSTADELIKLATALQALRAMRSIV